MNRKEKKVLVKQYLDAYNFFDIKSLKSVMHSDIIFTNIVNDNVIAKTHGIEEFTKFAKDSKKKYSLRKQTINKLNWENDNIIVDLDYEVLATSDRSIEVENGSIQKLKGKIVFQFSDNKISVINDSRT